MHLSLDIINDRIINAGQKILFRTPDYNDLIMLYDDGADVAVWTGSEDDIHDTFLEAKETDNIFILIGFGKEYDIAKVYSVPRFILSDKDNNHLIVQNFHFAVSERPDMPAGLVLPGNLLNNTTTCIKRIRGNVYVDIEYDKTKTLRTMGIKKKTLTKQELELLEHKGIRKKEIETIISSSYCFFQ